MIETASRAGKDDDLVRYLQMARKTLREPQIDTQLAVSYAKTDRLHDMEDFLAMTNVADQLTAGEQVFEAGMYQAARLLFSSISNWARLATTLIYLGENQAAVDAARKAGNTQVWRQVNMACLDKNEFKLAQICGLSASVAGRVRADAAQTSSSTPRSCRRSSGSTRTAATSASSSTCSRPVSGSSVRTWVWSVG